jgi:SnoaL-like domain
LINSNAWDPVAQLFTVDAVMDYGHLGVARGRRAIRKFFGGAAAGVVGRDSTEHAPPFVKQFIHAHDVRINHADPDRSTAISYLEAKPIYHGGSYLVADRFDDEYLRVDGRWLFATATLEVWFMVPAQEGWASPDRIRMSLDTGGSG